MISLCTRFVFSKSASALYIIPTQTRRSTFLHISRRTCSSSMSPKPSHTPLSAPIAAANPSNLTGASPVLPQLTPAEYKQYNRLAEGMEQYHNHFRSMWNTMYKSCETNRRPAGTSIRQFLSLGDQFCSMLHMHHGIEEEYIFPELAKKMPRFKDQEHLKNQHKEIHQGLEVFERYLKDCRSGENELRLDEMKHVMDSFGEVLWQHLDDEVKELGAENMRKYWTMDEIRKIHF